MLLRQPKWWRASGRWVTLGMVKSGRWRRGGLGMEPLPRIFWAGFQMVRMPALRAPDDVGFEEVAVEEGALGGGADEVEGHLKDARVGLAEADIRGVDADGEKFEEAFVGKVLIQAVAGNQRVGDDAHFDAGTSQLVEHGGDAVVDGGGQHDGLIPDPGEAA